MNIVRLLVLSCMVLSGCSQDSETSIESTKTIEQTKHAIAYEFNSDALHSRIKTISSDQFEGRKPATPGGKKIVDFLVSEYEKIGLQPAVADSYRQQVPLIEIVVDPAVTLNVTLNNKTSQYTYKEDIVVWTKHVSEQVIVEQSEVVFVGYGIVAPEYGWDDYAGIDVKGKTVLILVNDPGYATQDPNLFKGNSMTYYGRWTYKYEEAARQGAAMALVIHETAAAAYPWSVVESTWGGTQLDLVTADKNMSRSPVEGWLSLQATTDILAAAGYNYADLKTAALQDDFRALPLASQASIKLDNSLKESISYNVVGILPGTKRPDEYVVYMAHWDHFGTDPTIAGTDKIYNGALDNATGTAALLELAKAFVDQEYRPERSVVFLATTAEEFGLLGSRYYAEQPIFPLNRTVAGINIDGLSIIGSTRDIAIVGQGMSELEEYLSEEIGKQNRVVEPEAFPEKGYYYRSDHFNLAKLGVPMLYTHSGVDSVAHGREWGLRKSEDYVANNYHKPSDEYDENWDLTGALEDVRVYFNIGHRIANEQRWPNWYEKTEFKAIRDRSMDTN